MGNLFSIDERKRRVERKRWGDEDVAREKSDEAYFKNIMSFPRLHKMNEKNLKRPN